jgi:cystathionine gamma-synthase
VANPGRSPTVIRNAVVEPAWHNVEYSYSDTEDFRRYLQGDPTRGRYGRYDNPSWRQVERRIADLESCDEALLYPSGMAALTAVVLSFVRAGDMVAYCRHSYRQLEQLFEEIIRPLGIEAVALDQSDTDRFDQQVRRIATEPSLRLVLLEVPSNPHLYMADIPAVRSHLRADTLLAVDSTFASPRHLNPCLLGAELVIHSCTKYIGGHGDLMAGAVAGSSGRIERLRRVRDITGIVSDAGVAFLINRSLDTFELRMRHYGETADTIARWLEAQPWVRRVFYTGLASHPHADLISRYLRGHAGLLAFELEADEAATSAFVDALKVPYMTSGFGSTRTLVEQLGIFTFYRLDAAQREALGITDSLIRLSIGMETADRLIADMEQAAARTLLVAQARSPSGGIES